MPESLFIRARRAALRRLRKHPLKTVQFGMIGAVTGALTIIPEWIDQIEWRGIDAFLNQWPRESLAIGIASFAVVVILRLSTEEGGDLVRRPFKFIGMLCCGAAAATLINWPLKIAFGGSDHMTITTVPLRLYVNFYTETVLWGGLIGWSYFLSLQRAENQQRLAMLLGKRVVLARQLAKSRLGAARAQIDPAMVAAVLARVRAGYLSDPVAAASVLDQLTSYLRMALNRVRNDNSSTTSNDDVLRAYLAMRESEQGLAVTKE